MYIFLCRHTKVHNPNGVVYRRHPGFSLAEDGREQVKFMADCLRKFKIKEIFVSPMKRCQETAHLLKVHLNDPSIEIFTKDYLNEWGRKERTREISKRMSMILRGKKSNRVYISHKDPIRVFLNKITGRILRDVEYWECPLGAIYKINVKQGRIKPKLVFYPETK